MCEIGYVMPRFISTVNVAVGALSEEQYLAVCVWYAMGLDRNGKEYSAEEKALALEISEDALLERLRRARIKLANSLGKATDKRVDFGHRQSIVSA